MFVCLCVYMCIKTPELRLKKMTNIFIRRKPTITVRCSSALLNEDQYLANKDI